MVLPALEPLQFDISKAPSIESFLTSFCQKSFPEQLNGDRNNLIREQKVPIEPFFGKWCWKQFEYQPSDTENQDDSQDIAIQRLYKNHLPVEVQLHAWGAALVAQSGSVTASQVKLPLEPFVGEWCLLQFPQVFGSDSYDVKGEMAHMETVPIEASIGDWCFASFPTALGESLNQTETVEGLYLYHEKIENDILSWFIVEQHIMVEPSSEGNTTQMIGGTGIIKTHDSANNAAFVYTDIVFASVLIAATVVTFFLASFCWRRRRGRDKGDVHTNENIIPGNGDFV